MEIFNKSDIPRKYITILNKCADMAEKSCMKSRHCACIEKNGVIYMFALNDYCGINCSSSRMKFSCHAEEKILTTMTEKGRRKFNLFVVRISQNGKMVNSKPCKTCIEIIIEKKSCISKVIYTLDNDAICVEKPRNVSTYHVSIGNRAKNRIL